MPETAPFPEALSDRYAAGPVAGVGGMSVVYRARELATGILRAVKVLSAGADGLRAQREVQLLAALSHPGLVAVADAGVLPDGRAWIAMQWLDGETLAERLRRSPLSVSEALSMGRAVADALAYLHSVGVTHRDVKPSNVLLVDGDPRRATLLDLGIARSGPDAAGLTATGVLVGTPGYMAPEQVRDPRRAGPPSDVFSLGCVLFAAATGRDAFGGATALEIVAHALHTRAPAVLSVDPTAPPALAALVDAMLDPDPAGRPRDGAAAAAAIAAIEQSLTLTEASRRPATAALSFEEALPSDLDATLAHAARDPTGTLVTAPFVGRRRELGLLGVALDDCFDRRRPAVALVTAPAGMGKTRLADAWAERLAGDVTVLRARAERTAFGLVAAVLRASAGGDGPTLSTRLRAMARDDLGAAADDDLVELVARLAGLSPVELPSLVAAERDRALMAARLRAAWVRWIGARCARGPLVLLLDDLHDADPGSVDLLALVLRRVSAPLFVLGLRRETGAADDALAELATVQVALGPLSAPESERLAKALLGDADATVVAALVERSSGHPTVLEELARVARDGALPEAPSTVRALLHARLAALDGAQRRTLRAASVLGPVFWRGAVAAMVGEAEAQLDAALARLERVGVVSPSAASRFPDEPEWSLRSALLGEVTYETLTPIDRARGHAHAARWLIAAGERDARVVATHLLRGGASVEAVPWLVRAAERSLDANDLPGALRAVDEGVAAGAAAEAFGALRSVEAAARKWRGDLSGALEAARSAVGALSLSSGPGLLACAELLTLAGMLGDRALLLGWGAQLLALPVRAETLSEHAIAVARAAMQTVMTTPAEAGPSMAWLAAHVTAEVMAGDAQVAARTLAAQGFAAMVAGDAYGCAVGLERSALEHARIGDLRGACSARTNAAFARATLGQYALAEASLREAAVEADALGLSSLAADITQNLADARLGGGDAPGALALADEALAAHVRFGATRMEAATRTVRARALLAAGRWAEAAEEAARAYALGDVGTPRRALASAAWARALAAQGRSDEALTRAAEARAVAAGAGLDEGEGQVWIAWVEALGAAGRGAEARAAAAEALAWVEASAARVDDAAARETMRSAVPEHAALRAWAG